MMKQTIEHYIKKLKIKENRFLWDSVFLPYGYCPGRVLFYPGCRFWRQFMAVFQRRLLYIATDGKNRTSDLGEERGQSEKCLQSCQYRTYTDRYLRHGQNISIYKNGQDSYLFTLHLYFEWNNPGTADAYLPVISDIFQKRTVQ